MFFVQRFCRGNVGVEVLQQVGDGVFGHGWGRGGGCKGGLNGGAVVGHLKVGEGAAGGREGECDLGDGFDQDIGTSRSCRDSMDLLLLREMSKE